MRYLPNVLTLARILITYAFLYCALSQGFVMKSLAVYFFIVASMSDYFDGFLARKYNWISDFGKIMDPIADKFLVLSGFFVLVFLNYMPLWMLIVIIVREVYLTVLRLLAMKQGKVLMAENLGKYKTVLQMGTIFVGLLLSVFLEREHKSSLIEMMREHNYSLWYGGLHLLLWGVVILTIFSGVSFLWGNRHILYQSGKIKGFNKDDR